MSLPIVRLVKGRGRVLEPFFDRVFVQDEIRRLVWVSPWLTHFPFKTADTRTLLTKLAILGSQVTVITRPPEAASEHDEFIRDLSKLPSVAVYTIPKLHAKYYVCTTTIRAFALIGSANLYRWTRNSFEVGVVVESRGDGETLLDDLEALTIELRTHRETALLKRQEVRI